MPCRADQRQPPRKSWLIRCPELAGRGAVASHSVRACRNRSHPADVVRHLGSKAWWWASAFSRPVVCPKRINFAECAASSILLGGIDPVHPDHPAANRPVCRRNGEFAPAENAAHSLRMNGGDCTYRWQVSEAGALRPGVTGTLVGRRRGRAQGLLIGRLARRCHRSDAGGFRPAWSPAGAFRSASADRLATETDWLLLCGNRMRVDAVAATN
jgi:hypothetical protein